MIVDAAILLMGDSRVPGAEKKHRMGKIDPGELLQFGLRLFEEKAGPTAVGATQHRIAEHGYAAALRHRPNVRRTHSSRPNEFRRHPAARILTGGRPRINAA